MFQYPLEVENLTKMIVECTQNFVKGVRQSIDVSFGNEDETVLVFVQKFGKKRTDIQVSILLREPYKFPDTETALLASLGLPRARITNLRLTLPLLRHQANGSVVIVGSKEKIEHLCEHAVTEKWIQRLLPLRVDEIGGDEVEKNIRFNKFDTDVATVSEFADLYVLVIEENTLFNKKSLTLPGGKRLLGETSWAAACREMYEEIGLVVRTDDHPWFHSYESVPGMINFVVMASDVYTKSTTIIKSVCEFTNEPHAMIPVVITDNEIEYMSKIMLDGMMKLMATTYSPGYAKALLKNMIDASVDCPKKEYRNNLVGTVEKISDQQETLVEMDYFIDDCAHKKGVNMSKLFELVQKANMHKLDPKTRTFLRRENGEIMTPVGWEAPNIFNEIVRQMEEGGKGPITLGV